VTFGAQAISNSYGGSETGTAGIEASYNHPATRSPPAPATPASGSSSPPRRRT
jgi:hypothetical protein